jgi:hypothetical protein
MVEFTKTRTITEAARQSGGNLKGASEMAGVFTRRIMLVLLVAVPLVCLAYGLVARVAARGG